MHLKNTKEKMSHMEVYLNTYCSRESQYIKVFERLIEKYRKKNELQITASDFAVVNGSSSKYQDIDVIDVEEMAQKISMQVFYVNILFSTLIWTGIVLLRIQNRQVQKTCSRNSKKCNNYYFNYLE